MVCAVIIAAVFAALVGGAIIFRKKDKKNYGSHCVGCPYRDMCGGTDEKNSRK